MPLTCCSTARSVIGGFLSEGPMPETLAPGQEPLSLEGYLNLERSQSAAFLDGDRPTAPATEAQVREAGRMGSYLIKGSYLVNTPVHI